MKTAAQQIYEEIRATIAIPPDPWLAFNVSSRKTDDIPKFTPPPLRPVRPAKVRTTVVYDTRPRPGEESFSIFKAREAARQDVTKEAINFQLKKGKYPGYVLRRVHQNLAFISFQNT